MGSIVYTSGIEKRIAHTRVLIPRTSRLPPLTCATPFVLPLIVPHTMAAHTMAHTVVTVVAMVAVVAVVGFHSLLGASCRTQQGPSPLASRHTTICVCWLEARSGLPARYIRLVDARGTALEGNEEGRARSALSRQDIHGAPLDQNGRRQ